MMMMMMVRGIQAIGIDESIDPNKSTEVDLGTASRIESVLLNAADMSDVDFKQEVGCFLPSRVKSYWFQVGNPKSNCGQFGTKWGQIVTPK